MRLNDIFQKIDKNKKVIIAGCEKFSEIDAAIKGKEEGLFYPILVGNPEKIKDKVKDIEIIPAYSHEESVRVSCELLRDGKGDILMKGSVQTSIFLKGVLNKEYGLFDKGILSHIAILDIPNYHKILMITDGGMCIRPDLPTKKEILKNAVNFAKGIGIEKPKVGILSAVEVVNPDMPETMDAAALSKMAQRGDFGDCFVEGPVAMDIILSKEASEMKGVKIDISGDVDIILVPDIVSGNGIAKSLIYLANAKAAGIIVGTKKPVVMLSRSDTMETKLNSILLGLAI